jgi:alpha-N-arabinofuranosidase
MITTHSISTRTFLRLAGALCVACLGQASLNAKPTLVVDATHPAGNVSPLLYGLMTEEINHSYEGGLYAELIRNRTFQDSDRTPVNWYPLADEKTNVTLTLDHSTPLNPARPVCLRLAVRQATPEHPAGVANEGYWGVPVYPDTEYRASLWARAEDGFSGPLTVSLADNDTGTVYASAQISGIAAGWEKFEVKLKTGPVRPTSHAHFALTTEHPGTLWLNVVSLFPPTWNDRPNGLRRDLMQMLVNLHPKFLRFPGGNYLEGNQVEERFPWQKTLGPVEERPGHPVCWGYRSSDGMGLLEFLEWCEDMQAMPVLAVYAGYSLSQAHVKAGPELEPFVREALDEIEYVTGGTNTVWGARRARDGHPGPFPLEYVEIGNEDGFDKAKTYDLRFAQFADAIRAKYPQLKLISTIPDAKLNGRKADMVDRHDYSSTAEFVKKSATYGNDLDRQGPEIFVGEWAAHEETSARPWDAASKKLPPTPTFKSALGDSVFLAAMERHSDRIKMQCYAPLLVNVNPWARQWRPDLIGYDALSAYGSPSYYALQMFSRNLGDEILSTTFTNTSVQGSATRNSQTGEIILKLVNPEETSQTLPVKIKGTARLASRAVCLTLAGKLGDTNSIDTPTNVVPVTTTFVGVRPSFKLVLPPYSIQVLKLEPR